MLCADDRLPCTHRTAAPSRTADSASARPWRRRPMGGKPITVSRQRTWTARPLSTDYCLLVHSCHHRMRFSNRVPSDLGPNRFAVALSSACEARRGLIDLTVSNPTDVGLHYPSDLLAPLSGAASLVYEPDPFGLPSARLAVAGDFARRGLDVPATRVVLTASTSEAYSILFKLLCDA